MQLAYLILAHRYPHQLVRLVHRLKGQYTSFFIHLDRKMNEGDVRQVKEALAETKHIYFVERQACEWGGFGIVQATLKGLYDAVEKLPSFDYLVLLSGQDYPIKTNEQITQFFHQNSGTSFINNNPFPYSHWPRENYGWDRIQQWYIRTSKRFYVLPGTNISPSHRFNLLWNKLVRASPLKRRFPKGQHPYGGAQFWALHRSHVKIVYDYTLAHPEFVKFFRYVFIPDEILFQTLAGNLIDKDRIYNDTLHYIDWNLPGLVITSTELDALKATPHLFARKLDTTVDAAVLDLIDKELLHVTTTME
jgi:hypothetical protein